MNKIYCEPLFNKSYLKIGIDEWEEAYKNIRSLSAFAVYLYFAGTKIGRTVIDQKYVLRDLSLSKSAYHHALEKLSDLGYLLYDKSEDEVLFTTVPTDELYDHIQEDENEVNENGSCESENNYN